MGFIDLGTEVENIPEPQPVPEGTYHLIIEDSKFNPKNNCIQLRATIEGFPDAKPVFHLVSLPKADDDEKKRLTKLQFLKRFVDKFKVPTTGTGLNEEDFLGCSADVKLIVEEYEGIPGNKIKI